MNLISELLVAVFCVCNHRLLFKSQLEWNKWVKDIPNSAQPFNKQEALSYSVQRTKKGGGNVVSCFALHKDAVHLFTYELHTLTQHLCAWADDSGLGRRQADMCTARRERGTGLDTLAGGWQAAFGKCGEAGKGRKRSKQRGREEGEGKLKLEGEMMLKLIRKMKKDMQTQAGLFITWEAVKPSSSRVLKAFLSVRIKISNNQHCSTEKLSQGF